MPTKAWSRILWKARLFAAVDLAGADPARLRPLIDQAGGGKWRAYASDAWFRRHESACEAVLAEFLGALSAAAPAKKRSRS